MEISVSLDENSSRPLYDQIYLYLRGEILAGRLQPLEKLPSSRGLAANLHVARSTVEHAYEQLMDEGYVAAKKNSGIYVCGLENIADQVHFRKAEGRGEEEQDRRPGEAGKAEVTPPGMAGTAGGKEGAGAEEERPAGQVAKEPKEGAGIDFSLRRIDMSHFPYATWRRIIRGAMSGDNSAMFERGEAKGDRAFRETIAAYLHFSRGVRCRAEQIIIGAGNDYLLMLLCSILGTDRRIGMENPSYLRAFRVFAAQGEKVVVTGQDESGMLVQDLEDADCDAAYCMPAHQYPTGVMMPYPRRLELLQWAGRREGRYIIEDDYDSEFRYRGRPVAALQSLDQEGRVIYLGTFSKSIAPAIRVSYMVLPERQLADYEARCGYASSTVSRIDQHILNDFIAEGYFERYLNRMRNLYRQRHDLLLACLEPLRKQFDVQGENAGLHLILEERDTGDQSVQEVMKREEELQKRAAARGVHIYTMHEMLLPGLPVPKKEMKKPRMLLGYAALNEDEIREGCKRLNEALS